MSFRRSISLRALKGLLFGVVLYLFFQPARAAGEEVDRVLAVVNGTVITQSELTSAIAQQEPLLQEMALDGASPEGRSVIMDILIEGELVRQGAEKAGIDVSDGEVTAAIEGIMSDNSVSEAEFEAMIRGSGMTMDHYREQIGEQIRQVKFSNLHLRSRVVISDEMVEEYYNSNRGDFVEREGYRIKLLFLEGKDGGVLDEEGSLTSEMKRRFDLVKSGVEGGADFGSLVKEHSDGPARESGGDLGTLKFGEADKRIEDVVRTLTPGEVGRPVVTDKGIYIVQLVEMAGSKLAPLEEVRSGIENILFQRGMEERYNEWLDEMKSTSHIEVRF